jgi:hypothetical protein
MPFSGQFGHDGRFPAKTMGKLGLKKKTKLLIMTQGGTV